MPPEGGPPDRYRRQGRPVSGCAPCSILPLAYAWGSDIPYRGDHDCLDRVKPVLGLVEYH